MARGRSSPRIEKGAKGHVHIELLTAAVSPRTRFWLTRVVYAFRVLTCIVIFWFALEVTIDQWRRTVIDVCARSTCRAGS